MTKPFPDRSGVLFGREPDLAYLLTRASYKGVSVVLGRAQMGKSWLLTETARRLALSADPPLVGYTECMGESADQFLRATVDLYTCWLEKLSNAGYALSHRGRHWNTGRQTHKVSHPASRIGKRVCF